MSAGGSNKAILAAFAANLGIAIAKFVAFLVTGATSMLAESVHSLADTGNQGLLLLGGKRASRPADDDHQFGYARERYFWAFVVALVLFSLGALFAIYEGIHKLQHPEPVESIGIAFGVLAGAILLESFSLRVASTEAAAMKGTRTWRSFIRTSKNAELPVVLIEDVGAMAGLAVALISLLLSWKVDPIFDGVGTLIIGGLLGVLAIVLAIEMKSLLIGEAADPEEQGRIQGALEGSESVERVIHLRTEHLGPETVLVAAKLEFLPSLTMPELAAAIDNAEVEVRKVVPYATLIYIEPDLFRGDPPENEQ